MFYSKLIYRGNICQPNLAYDFDKAEVKPSVRPDARLLGLSTGPGDRPAFYASVQLLSPISLLRISHPEHSPLRSGYLTFYHYNGCHLFR